MDYLQVRMIYLTNQSDSLEIEIIWGMGEFLFPPAPRCARMIASPQPSRGTLHGPEGRRWTSSCPISLELTLSFSFSFLFLDEPAACSRFCMVCGTPDLLPQEFSGAERCSGPAVPLQPPLRHGEHGSDAEPRARHYSTRPPNELN